jgi:hypothetical protein
MAYGLAERLLERAQNTQDPALLTFAYLALGDASSEMGEFILAKQHLETAIGRDLCASGRSDYSGPVAIFVHRFDGMRRK